MADQSAPVNLNKYGLHLAVASIAASGIQQGHNNATRLEAYVMEALHSVTILEVRDMLHTILAAQDDSNGLPLGLGVQVFAASLRDKCAG